MHTLRRNQKTIYFKNYVSKTPIVDEYGNATGEYTITYGALNSIKAYVSAAKGNADIEMFGVNTNYTHVVIVDNVKCSIDENSILWINNATTGEHDFIVQQVAKSLNHIVYAVRQVNVSIEVPTPPTP